MELIIGLILGVVGFLGLGIGIRNRYLYPYRSFLVLICSGCADIAALCILLDILLN